MDNELLELEQQTEYLIREYQQLKQVNSNLRASNASLIEEQNQLHTKASEASNKIRHMIARLKSIEGTDDGS